MSQQLFLVCGEDDYLVESAAREHIRALVPPSDREWGLEVIDGSVHNGEEVHQAVENCLSSLQTPSLFGGAKLTWLKNANFLTGGDRSVADTEVAKNSVAKLTEYLKAGLWPEQLFLITTPKLLRSSVFFKTCKQTGSVEDFGSGLKPWEKDKAAEKNIAGLAKNAGLTFAAGAKEEFINRVGPETRLLVQELEKLRLYLYPEKKITVEAIHEITSIGREAFAWDLTDAVGERNAWKALKTLYRLSGQRGFGIMISAMLDKMIREMITLREACDKGWLKAAYNGPAWATNLPPQEQVVLNALPIDRKGNPWAMKKKLTHALNFSLNELRAARFYILELREKLVSTQLPELFLTETAILRIIGKPKTPSDHPHPGGQSC